MTDINTHNVLAECYGMLTAMRADHSDAMAEIIDRQLAQIERVMGEIGREWRAKRLAEREAA